MIAINNFCIHYDDTLSHNKKFSCSLKDIVFLALFFIFATVYYLYWFSHFADTTNSFHCVSSLNLLLHQRLDDNQQHRELLCFCSLEATLWLVFL